MLRCILKRSIFYNCNKLMQLRYMSTGSESGGDGDHHNQATLITGGLDKFQGGLKEEQYFLNENNKLIIKMKERVNMNVEKSPDVTLNATALTEPRDMACAPCKHKNFPEEIFFLDEQTECTKRLCKRLNDEANMAEGTPTDKVAENQVESNSNN